MILDETPQLQHIAIITTEKGILISKSVILTSLVKVVHQDNPLEEVLAGFSGGSADSRTRKAWPRGGLNRIHAKGDRYGQMG
jgi:hypothetical protein